MNAYLLGMLAGIADVVVILQWLQIEPQHIFRSEAWRMRQVPISGGKLFIILLLAVISVGFSTYGYIHAINTKPFLVRQLSYGTAEEGCNASIYTGDIPITDRQGFYLYLACGAGNPAIDKFNDIAITVSSPFSITADQMDILAPWNPATKSKLVGHTTTTVWHVVFVLPRAIDASRVTRLTDIGSLGGIVLENRAF